MVELTLKQQDILATSGHMLVTGGPGSGKTTVAIIKAGSVTAQLKAAQSVLFLSFARATVARIIEAIAEEKSLSRDAQRRIEVDTYHAFFWRILRTHGYLLGLPRRLELVTPPNEAIALAPIRRGYKTPNKLTDAERHEKAGKEEVERDRLAKEEGKICFSQFAPLVAKLLKSSNKVRRLFCDAYPIIVLDEFQDTNPDQWEVVKSLGSDSELIALADPEQRIFEFAGAEAKRLQQYKDTFKPATIDLQGDNHRSKGTDITRFGNDILTGKFTQDAYEGMHYNTFSANANQAFACLHGETLQARVRQLKSGKKGWTIAVLVPTRRMTRLVSDAFREPLAGMPTVVHTAAVDMEGPILAAELLAFLLQQVPGIQGESQCVDLVCSFYRGKDGDTPTKGNTTEADRIGSAYSRCAERRRRAKLLRKTVFIMRCVQH